MGSGIQERKVELDTAGRLERMSVIELGTDGVFPLLHGHEGVVEGDVRAEVKRGLLVGDGSTEVRGI